MRTILVLLIAVTLVRAQDDLSSFFITSPACCTITFSSLTAPIIVITSEGVVQDGEGNDLATLPLEQQVAKLCAALAVVAQQIKITKCGGS